MTCSREMKLVAVLATVVAGGAVLSACSTGSSGYATRDALVAPVNCTDRSFEIYFDEGQARLAPSALTLLQMTGQQLSGCDIRKVSVVGLSDASGGSNVNQSLSERRAQAVRDALAAQGWPAPVFEVSAVGAQGAREGQINEPLRRRTEVRAEAAPRR
ncbi:MULTISPECIES: OmpA family protein [unclassified Brevundimonas]|uniref:OmpA family protein n=1 Tax=unclassified Brevundimonas TaxID=2622653 RepID=UPI0025BBE13A|nr:MULTISPECIES: OmpA family protein [unclassified Brevundimonas]